MALGIQNVVTENMAAATRMHLAEKGRDPADYTLMAFGGAGPVHAYALAKRLKARRVLVPPAAGVISAFGFLVAAPMADAVRGYRVALDAVQWSKAQALCDEMEAAVRGVASAGGRTETDLTVTRSADMRYLGQGYEIEVTLPTGRLGAACQQEIRVAFADAYRSKFGRTIDDARPEFVNWRCTAKGRETPISLASATRRRGAAVGSRRIRFLDSGELDAPVYDRSALEPGTVIPGPAVFTEHGTSCGFGPDCRITVDRRGNLRVEIELAERRGRPSAVAGEGEQ